VLDVGVNKPFKDYRRERQTTFLIERPSLNDKPTWQFVAKWVSEAWDRVAVETIVIWRYIGISAALC
jgi:hypothetical protein